MRHWILVASAATLAATGACEPATTARRPSPSAPASRQVRPYEIEEFLSTVSMGGTSFSPDGGTILVSSDQTGIDNAYAIPVAGGEPVQLTHSKTDHIAAHSYFPADRRFVYTSDQGGNELTHVYVRELDGLVKDLTPGRKVKARLLGWSHDNKSLFVSTNERDPRAFDLYEITVDGYRRSLLYRNADGYEIAAVAPNRRFIALNRRITLANSDAYLYDRQTKRMKHLTPHAGEVANWAESFSPDGRSLYLITDEGSEFRHLVRYDLATGARTIVERPPWDVAGAEFTRDGRHFIVAINADARTELLLYEAATMRRIALPDLPNADITDVEVSRDGRRMAYYVHGDRSPGDLWVRDLTTGAERQLTRNLSPKVGAVDLVEGQGVRFKSYDGVEIPGILYRPHQAAAGRKVPALVWVHGGPGDQSRFGYDPFIQYLVNHGYAVYSINNRGSSGYGKTFHKMDDRRHGEADLDDCVASKQMLAATGWIDPERIGILGRSYGGYMVLAALTFRPTAFRVGVDLYGVSNWPRLLVSVPAWWGSLRDALYAEVGDPGTDSVRLARISPLFHATQIRRPLLVLQGANDPRVLQIESDEIVAAVRASGVPVEYLVFADEGHGITKRANQVKAYRATLDFLDKYLR